jgi:hypothetical protein
MLAQVIHPFSLLPLDLFLRSPLIGGGFGQKLIHQTQNSLFGLG